METRRHIEQMMNLMGKVISNLYRRSFEHDASKLISPEKEMFDRFSEVAGCGYGSPEYAERLKEMGPALQHHYHHNSHHPESFESGVDDMSLLDLLEMICDWKASNNGHGNGNFASSLEINRERFGMSDQLYNIFVNTARELWGE
jgi:hypothetical protein